MATTTRSWWLLAANTLQYLSTLQVTMARATPCTRGRHGMVLAISRWSEVKEFIWDSAQVSAVYYSIFLTTRATITPLQTVFSRYSRLLESVMGILHGKFV